MRTGPSCSSTTESNRDYYRSNEATLTFIINKFSREIGKITCEFGVRVRRHTERIPVNRRYGAEIRRQNPDELFGVSFFAVAPIPNELFKCLHNLY
ncbi:hypothetical protein AArcCO_1206 [Halalkaliarchaeum sp. AArc-CO]|nr:hypothetical protein AArcCO_1206 [Halalkaliarchaeum sp. AArc-CO]